MKADIARPAPCKCGGKWRARGQCQKSGRRYFRCTGCSQPAVMSLDGRRLKARVIMPTCPRCNSKLKQYAKDTSQRWYYGLCKSADCGSKWRWCSKTNEMTEVREHVPGPTKRQLEQEARRVARAAKKAASPPAIKRKRTVVIVVAEPVTPAMRQQARHRVEDLMYREQRDPLFV